jgi:hypothetical protein
MLLSCSDLLQTTYRDLFRQLTGHYAAQIREVGIWDDALAQIGEQYFAISLNRAPCSTAVPQPSWLWIVMLLSCSDLLQTTYTAVEHGARLRETGCVGPLKQAFAENMDIQLIV